MSPLNVFCYNGLEPFIPRFHEERHERDPLAQAGHIEVLVGTVHFAPHRAQAVQCGDNLRGPIAAAEPIRPYAKNGRNFSSNSTSLAL